MLNFGASKPRVRGGPGPPGPPPGSAPDPTCPDYLPQGVWIHPCLPVLTCNLPVGHPIYLDTLPVWCPAQKCKQYRCDTKRKNNLFFFTLLAIIHKYGVLISQ